MGKYGLALEDDHPHPFEGEAQKPLCCDSMVSIGGNYELCPLTIITSYTRKFEKSESRRKIGSTNKQCC